MAATGEIDIFGTLNAATTKGVIAKASQVKDETQKKMQSVINSEVQTALAGKATQADITSAINDIMPLIYAGL